MSGQHADTWQPHAWASWMVEFCNTATFKSVCNHNKNPYQTSYADTPKAYKWERSTFNNYLTLDSDIACTGVSQHCTDKKKLGYNQSSLESSITPIWRVQ